MSERAEEAAFVVGKWAIGIDKRQDLTVLRCEFDDRPPLVLAISREDAEQIAKAMLDQLEHIPPSRAAMS